MKQEQPPRGVRSDSDRPTIPSRRWRWGCLWAHRTESLILSAGFLCTAVAKGVALNDNASSISWLGILRIILPDLVFFLAVYVILRLLYRVHPSVWSARFGLLISILVGGWSLLNAAWLLCSGVQLQSGIVLVLLRDMKDVWPLMESHIRLHQIEFALFSLLSAGVLLLLILQMIHPQAIRTENRGQIGCLPAAGGVLIVSILALPILDARAKLGFAGEVLGFNSHWTALVNGFPGGRPMEATRLSGRQIPRAGTRLIGPPTTPIHDQPNVVLVLLESVAYKVVPRESQREEQMPFLAQLARDGVEFHSTRVPIARTTKAYWSALTGSTPILESDYAEAVPVEHPYESIATILSRAGYRSGFFEMSKGTFECAPGLFHNFGFEWAWFRENLEDPSAHVGYLGGDDMRLIDPAVEWATAKSDPFFLVVITSISHDPYLVPRSFEEPVQDPLGRYLQTVRYTDQFVRTLYEKLRENGLTDNLLLCVQGDHGTSLGVDRDMARWRPREEVIRIPWVIHWPGHIPAGTVVDGLCSQIDTTPTILGLLGFDLSQAGFDGQDVWTHPPKPDRTVYFWSWYDQSPIGLIRGATKFVYWPFYDELLAYDLSTDPDEMTPRSLSGSEKESIVRELVAWQEDGRIHVDARNQSGGLFYGHWQTFSSGRKAWAYYIP
jgi:arylsulfatase A-like enzyme